MKRFTALLIALALIAGTVGCPAAPQYDLSISSTAGGAVIEPGEGTFTYSEGRVVILRADAEQGHRFVKWTGSIDQISDVNAATTTITVSAHCAAIANFEAISVAKYDLAVSSTAGGSVTTPGEGTFPYDAGMVVSLVATPATGYRFVNWTGDVATIGDVNSAETTISMNGNYQVSANFEEEEAVHFADPNLDVAVREAIDVHERPIYPSDLEGLTSLYAYWRNIGDLTGIEHCANLSLLGLGGNKISNLSPLASLTNLTGLDLHANVISDVSPLRGLTRLTLLGLWHNRIEDVSPLANLTSLMGLWLRYNEVSDISPLASLTNLTELELVGNPIGDISVVAGLTSLTTLVLGGTPLTDISPIAGLTSLTKLYIQNSQISDIAPLADLTGLTALALGFNQISDMSLLASFTNLKTLHLESSQISDLSPLTGLTDLEELGLTMNRISDLSPLANLTNLRWLWLAENRIGDVSPLANLTDLKLLRLDGNLIVDIGALSSLTDLRGVWLDNNSIADISPLSALIRIGELEQEFWPIEPFIPGIRVDHREGLDIWLGLRNNRITDIGPLLENAGLSEGDGVDMRGNPLSSQSRNTHIPELVARGVNVLYD